jgi:hypothetical protein
MIIPYQLRITKIRVCDKHGYNEYPFSDFVELFLGPGVEYAEYYKDKHGIWRM